MRGVSSKNFTWINSFHLYHNTVRYCEIPVALLVPSLLDEATKIPAQDHSARNRKPSDTSQSGYCRAYTAATAHVLPSVAVVPLNATYSSLSVLGWTVGCYWHWRQTKGWFQNLYQARDYCLCLSEAIGRNVSSDLWPTTLSQKGKLRLRGEEP